MRFQDTSALIAAFFVTALLVMTWIEGPQEASAAGPKEVALVDRALWPLPLDSRAGFDTASRAEILVFLEVFFDLEEQGQGQDYASLLGIKSVHTDSIARWRDETVARMAANLRAARSTCGDTAELGCPQASEHASTTGSPPNPPAANSPPNPTAASSPTNPTAASSPPNPTAASSPTNPTAASSPTHEAGSDDSIHRSSPTESPYSREALKAAVTDFKARLPSTYAAWYGQARRFYERYVLEQLRLAALFPSPTSEILTFSPQEVTGADWEDLHFLLTFDDGPSLRGGDTDKLLRILAGQRVTGIFFVLGEAFRTRLEAGSKEALQALYSGQCVGSHGEVHRPHPRLETWQESIRSTQTLIGETIDNNSPRFYFRPPYGQRTEEMVRFVTAQGSTLLLWNIDTQDWNEKVSAERAADRAVTLMLLWRRGIILFHDVHAKAQIAVPRIVAQTAKTGLVWVDCRTLVYP